MQGLGAERFALPKKQGRLGTPRGRAFVVALVVVGLAVAGYLGYQRFIAASAAPPPVQTVQVRRGSLESTVSATGTVAARQASLGFGAAGRVKSIDVAVGQQVQAGQTLATLDTESLQLQLEQARSNERAARLKLQQLQEGATPEEIEAARAALAAAESRARYLAASSDGSDVQAAEAAVSAAEATLAGARARLQQLEAGPDPAEVAQAEQAVAAAQAALEAGDRTTAVERFLEVAAAHAAAGRPAAALDACARIVGAYPDALEAQEALVHLYLELGWRSLAIEKVTLLERLTAMGSDPLLRARVLLLARELGLEPSTGGGPG